MLYYLVNHILAKILYFPGINLFRYITFRSVAGAVIAFLISLYFGPRVIHQLKRLKIGQIIRNTVGGPNLGAMHKAKSGTPTMGGILILIALMVPILLLCDFSNRLVGLTVLVTLWLGLVGFLDDYLKLMKRQSEGLNPRQKMGLQLILGLIVGVYLFIFPIIPEQRYLYFPFFKHLSPDISWLYIPFAMMVIVSTSNAVNLTDGLDGLAIGCVTTSALSYLVMTYVIGRSDFAAYLNVPYVPGAGELTVVVSCLIGASLGFLWYNCHPAKVFMGDTGSLALGGILGIIALLIKQEFSLFIVGGIFVMEALSVIIQVTSFKLRGKRVFLMSPIHHHFEKAGIKEETIIVRFWIISAILALIGLGLLKVR